MREWRQFAPLTPNNTTPGRPELEAPAQLIMTPGRAELEAPGQLIMTSRLGHNAWLPFLGVSIRFVSHSGLPKGLR